MISYLGDFSEDATVYIMFNTFSSDDPSASCTITNFVNTDVHIHKDDGLTQRNNAAGITVSVDFDGITGSHMVKIDTSDNTVAGFWVVGHEYFVRIEGTTIDGATINSVIGQFSIENRFNEVDVVKIEGADPTDTIRDALVDDATRIDASALNTLSGHDPGANIAKAGDLMGLANDAITASKYDESTAFPLKSDDAGASQIARVGADGDTLETLSDQLDAVPTAAENVNEWETQSQTDPTGFHVNIKEINGTAQTANDVGADVNDILADTNELQTDWVNGGRLDLLLDAIPTTAMRGTDNAALAATALLNTTWTDAKAAFIDHSIATVDTNLDTLLTRITAARAGYLDNLSAGAVALAATALTDVTWTDAKAAFLDHSIATVDTNVDTILTRITAARAGYLDNLSAGAVALASALATAQTDLDTITGADGVTLATLQALYAPNKVVPDVAGTAATLHGVTDGKVDTAQDDLDILTGTDGVTLATTQGNYAPNKVVPDVAGTAAGLHSTTDGKVDAVQTDSTAIKAKTDNLPSGIAKNVALPKFDIYMVLNSDHVTAATGKTITGQISKDGGAFAGITNVISEVGNGMYTIASGFTQTEMNADVITLKFTETDCDQRIITIYTS